MEFFGFHPLIREWFTRKYAGPTEPQVRGWPAIASGGHTLIAAPTGSGKTLTGFLACIDKLLKESLSGRLRNETRVVYVSPLRALSNDMHKNLEQPLAELAQLAEQRRDLADPALFDKRDFLAESNGNEQRCALPITVGLRTGDTSSYQRSRLIKHPPHILVTTPESLYLMLTSERSRETLRSVETVIVDEIHALVRDKRGSHWSLTLERLDALTPHPLQRIGLSATQKPIERMAEFLTGSSRRTGLQPVREEGEVEQPKIDSAKSPDGLQARSTAEATPNPACAIIDVGHGRELDLAIETPPGELGAVCMLEQWADVNARIVELINSHRATLIFVNTRRLAERVTHQLTELLGEDQVGSHHGSLSSEIRLRTEQRLKAGTLKAVVATASLELGLDVGYIDLVIQLGSPRSIATFLQRIGRSGHSLGLTPKGRLFALTRDELVECMALVRAVRAGRLDAVPIPEAPLDVLAQQLVAEVAAQEWDTDALFDLVRRAYPYRDLSREAFDRTVNWLSEGLTDTAGRGRVYLHHDQVNRRLRARKAARLASVTNGGAIPEVFSYRVVAEPEQTVVGTLDEEFAVESNAGDVFLLGNTSWRIIHVRGGDVTVADAHGAPPTVPFWQGEAPGRTLELSHEVSRLREELEQRIHEPVPAARWLVEETSCTEAAAEQTVTYVAAQQAAIGLVPTRRRVVFERFFDETGGMQLVVHAPFGAGVTRAWGMAMRKRFCRSYDFELQATADDDGFILSIGPQHSFPIESLFPMLTNENARGLLEQALVTAPVFPIRWRWNVTRSLLVMRRQNGKKVAPPLQRFRSDDLLTAVFPRLTGCQEEHTGDIEIPDHPLVKQTMEDCLHEYVDVGGLRDVLTDINEGRIELIARDTREPSPFSYELLNSNPYTFLDGGEVQERRVRAVSSRRSLTVESVRDLGRLDPEAVAQVVREAQPEIRDADELHDVLLSRVMLVADSLIAACGLRIADCSGNASTPLHDTDAESSTEEMRVANSILPNPQSAIRNPKLQLDWFRTLVKDHRATQFPLPNGRTAWVATERWPAAVAVFPDAVATPPVTVPESMRQEWSSVDARVAMVRGLMETAGPLTGEQVADALCITAGQAAASLEALEGEGVVLQMNVESPEPPRRTGFQPVGEGDSMTSTLDDTDGLQVRPTEDSPSLDSGPSPLDPLWCHRRLLMRIHRLTINGLRKQIEPVSVDVFQRFLLRHHGVLPEHRRAGANGVFETVAMLQGIDLPAASWERDILPLRVKDYRSDWLDELCLTGEVAWARLYPPARNTEQTTVANLTRAVPVSIYLREDAAWLMPIHDRSEEELSEPARQVLSTLRERGALFLSDLQSPRRAVGVSPPSAPSDSTQFLSPAELRDVLGELVARGWITADGFGGLRHLLNTKSSNLSSNRHGKITRTRSASRSTGRWSLREECAVTNEVDVAQSANRNRGTHSDGSSAMDPEAWAFQLLRRWGVVFRDLLIREPGAPKWWQLAPFFRTLEARGEVRGGRFITGVAGEQFALGDTVRLMRQIREEAPRGELSVLSAADPLNLVGILTPHARVPSTANNKVAYLDGQPVGALQAGEVTAYDRTTTDTELMTRALRKNPDVHTVPKPTVAVDSAEPSLTNTMQEVRSLFS